MKTKVFIAACLTVLCLFNGAIWQKERILKNGDTVLLELVTVDPRSLMQGDYMRLNYKIDTNIPALSSAPAHGYIVIAVGPDHVGNFVRVDNGTPLRDGERRVRFNHDGATRVAPDSFMFQEGQAEFYRRARYGVFKFDGPDHYVLAGLADETRHTLVAPPAALKFDSTSSP
jgi:uncharacterized membrane-anchored protein